MPVQEKAHLAAQDELRRLARRLDAAGHGQRTALIDEVAAMFGWSRNKTYKLLAEVGWTSGRKKRADAGRTSQDEAALTDLSATLRVGLRANGKATMETPTARSLLGANGREFNVSNGRLNTLMRSRQMDLASQRRERPVQRQRSLHPNHVHQVDPSLCLIYYEPDGTQRMMDEAKFYKNKPANVARIEDFKVWRYVLVDHYSATIQVRYYRAAGETTANLWDFLLFCWEARDDCPFHGVPQILVWDKGSANTSKAIQCALNALDVIHIPHEAGNPRAKGSVENANNLVEKLFESRLRYEPIGNVDELNAAALGWMNAYNADRIPDYDARLQRRGMREPVSRFGLWQTIRQAHLRLLPERQLCQYLLSAEPRPRRVNNDMSVTFRHPNTKRSERYDLRHIPEAFAGATVDVAPLIYGPNQVSVTVEDYRGERHSHVCEALVFDAAGFETGAAVIGEAYKRPADTEIERRAAAADRAAYGGANADDTQAAKKRGDTPFGGLDAHGHLAHVDLPTYMRRKGTELDTPNRFEPERKPVSVSSVCGLLADRLGRPVTRDENAALRERFPDGVAEDAIDALVTELGSEPDSFTQPVLRVAK